MSNKLFKSFFAFAMVLGAALGFVACTADEEPAKVNPEISLSEQAVNFTSAEGSKTVSVTSNSQWEVKVDESADWVSVTPSSGNNNGTITVHVAANDSGAFRSTDVKVSVLNAEYNNAVWDTKKFTVSQSADENPIVEEVLLYSDNFDGEEATKTYGNSGNSWPYVDQFPQFANAQGSASENVTYEGTGVSIRVVSDGGSAGSHSDYNGSGSNNVFFGAGACFYVKNISPLQDGHNHYKITFGTEKYEQDGDSTFRNEEFILSISKNGEEWAPIEYTYPYSNSAEGRWNVATANFTLANVPEALYIKFEAKVGSVYRIDDLKLFVGNGGQAVDLDNIEVVAPEPPTTDALFFDNFDGKTAVKDGSGYWPYIADFPEMKNAAGPAAVNVAYEGYNTTVRNNSNSNGSYSDYDGSGLNNIFFGKDNAWFAIKDLTLEPTQKNLILTFGGDKYMQSGNSTFSTSEFLVSISGDGQKWSNVEYTFAGTTDGRWNVATANFTLAEVPAKLYIKFTATAESAYRLDDVTLDLGQGGQLIDLANGTTEEPSTPDQPVNPDQPNTPATGVYESDSAFVCAEDNSALAAYSLGSSTVNGASVSGFKLGTTKLAGYFKSGVVSVEGAKYLNFYAVAWKAKEATLYYRVDGGEATAVTLNANDGATGNPPYTITGVDANHYSVLLEGLTATSTIEFSTDATFTAASNTTSGRAVVFGVKLTDEALGAETPSEPENPGTEEPENPVDPETPAVVVATVAEFLAAAEGSTVYQLTGVITSVANTEYGNFYMKDDTAEVYIYGLCSPTGEQKYWAASGVKVGDTITVQTVRTSYNGTAQGKNAIYVSHIASEVEEDVVPEGCTKASVAFVDLNYANATSVNGQTISVDENVSVVFSQGGANNEPAYYTSGQAIRMYQNGALLDVAANGKTIKSIELTFANNQYYLDADSGSMSEEAPVRTWIGEATSVRFTATGTDKDHRAYVSAISVIYEN